MREIKRKAQHRSTAPKPQSHLNRIERICLAFFGMFLILFLGGYYIHNTPITFLGLGIGFAGFVIQTDINLHENNKYKQEGEK